MRRLIALLGVLSILAACGGAPAAPPTATSAPTPAAARPTATPRPAPTATTAAPPTATTAAAPTPAALGPEQLLQRPNALAFIAEDGALTMATGEGLTAPIWGEQQVESFAWAPDGSAIAFVAGGKLWLWPGNGAVKELGDEVAPQGRFSWRADGKLIAVETAGVTPTIGLVTLDGSAPPVFPGLEGARAPLFTPVGTALLAMKDLTPTVELAEAPLSTPYLWPDAGVEPISFPDSKSVMSWDRIAWSREGRTVAVSNLLLRAGGPIEALIAPPAQGLTGQLTVEQVANGTSPDNGVVALAGLVAPVAEQPDNKQTELSIYLRVPETQQVIWRTIPRLDPGFSWQVSPVSWTRDGRRLAFAGSGQPAASGVSGAGVWIGAADGSGLQLVPGSAGAELSAEGAIPTAPQWSPDNALLAWESGAAAERSIALWVPNTPQPRTLARGTMPRWRPQP